MKMIGILGARDGAGATLLSYEIAKTWNQIDPKEILLVDADPYFCGHLGETLGLDENPHTLSEWEKKNFDGHSHWAKDYLSGPGSLGILSIAKSRENLAHFPAESLWDSLITVSRGYHGVVIDLGSRITEEIAAGLKFFSGLLLVGCPQKSFILEVVRKVGDLASHFFPLERMGWVANQWPRDSVIAPKGLAQIISCRLLGTIPLLSQGSPFKEYVAPLVAAVEKMPGMELSANSNRSGEKPPDEHSLKLLDIIQEKLEARGVKSEKLTQESSHDLREKVRPVVQEILQELPLQERGSDVHAYSEFLLDQLLGLGPLEELLRDPAITEIMVNGSDHIYVERVGQLTRHPAKFLSSPYLRKAMERILAPMGRRLDESSPMVDCRLPDGSRVNMIIPPLALDGPTLTIRRFFKECLKPEDLLRFGSVTAPMLEYLASAVVKKRNILISGGTGTGKTTLLNILSNFIPADERIVTIEDAAELRLPQPHVVRLEARPPNIEGKGAVAIRDLVRNALRMRPDRIVVGECRGAEALDMLQAMNTGHDGSLTTIHANSPKDALGRLETLVLFAGTELPFLAIREQIRSAIDIVLQVARLCTGVRRVVSISELEGLEGSQLILKEIFREEEREAA